MALSPETAKSLQSLTLEDPQSWVADRSPQLAWPSSWLTRLACPKFWCP